MNSLSSNAIARLSEVLEHKAYSYALYSRSFSKKECFVIQAVSNYGLLLISCTPLKN
jgi:hypothetical protein